MSGFVYILSNPSMPGLLKIGSTEKLPTERAAQLFSTGVPEPFKVEFAVWCENHQQAELDIHEELKANRPSIREFFSVSKQDAILSVLRCVDAVHNHDVHPVNSFCFVDDSIIATLNNANRCNLDASQWLAGLTPDMASLIAIRNNAADVDVA
jgi:hypothetical protein